MFNGFPEATEQFFLELKFHNDQTFFHANHDRYVESVQKPFYSFIDDLMPTLLEIDPRMEPRPHKSLARIHRDTRFTKDKSPYRDHLWAFFHPAAEEKHGCIGFWFEYGVQRLNWGLGTWGENRLLMDRMRMELEAKPSYYMGLIDSCCLPSRHLTFMARTFKRMPIPAQIPERLKDWYAARELFITQTYPDMREAASRAILTHVADDFRACAPVYHMYRGMLDRLMEEETLLVQKENPRRDEWD